jgi:hypothetical protein
MTTFNIGNQNAGSIQNVGGDMAVHGGLHGSANVQVIELRGRLAQLSEELYRLPLPPESHAAARDALAEAETEAAAPEPRSDRIGRNLGRVTDVLEDAGALASAGTGLARALGRAVALVGMLVV